MRPPSFLYFKPCLTEKSYLLSFLRKLSHSKCFLNMVSFTDRSKNKFVNLLLGLKDIVVTFTPTLLPGSFVMSNVHFLLRCTCLCKYAV